MNDAQRQMFSSTTTHFFKVVLNETLRDKKIHIPKKFMRKHRETLTSPVILQLPSGVEWNIEPEICGGEVWLQKGWPEFANYYSLEQGHFLVFRYEGNSRFHVIIFDATATEIDYPINPAHFSKSHIDKDKLKKPKEEVIENDVSEAGEKFSVQCSRPHKRMKTSSISSKVVGKKKIKHCLSSIEKARALHGFKSENPFFSVVMRSSYVFKSHHNLTIPRKFASRYINKKEGHFTLRSSDDRTWSVQYKTRSKSNFAQDTTEIISSGWNSFARDNNLKVCDVCIFELIAGGNDMSHFQVSIIRHHDHLSGGFKSENPFFSVVMRSSYVYKAHHNLTIPKKFAERYISKKEGYFTLRISDGRTWSVQYKTRSKSNNIGYEITEISSGGGWNSFARQNNLEVCDICIFELISSGNDISHFQVSIVRHDDHISLGKLQAKSNATDVIRRKQKILGSERDRAHKRAVSSFRSENPFFSIVMQPSYIDGRGKLNIPNKFVARHINKREAEFNLRVSNGRCWSVRYRAVKRSRTINYCDWRAFAHDNKLEVGDICIFELITSENDILHFQVSFVRHSGQLSLDGNRDASNPVKEEICTIQIGNQIAKKECQNPKKRNRNQVQPTDGNQIASNPVKEETCTNPTVNQFAKKENQNPKKRNRNQDQPTAKSNGGKPPSSEVDFGGKNPSFDVCMRAYHFDHGIVAIPASFERLYLEKRTQNMKLMMGKRRWEVKLVSGGRLFLSKGWTSFARDNCVRIGDLCRFEKVEDNPPVFHVSITRAF
ncbi:putative B3 domain-containing protein Os03g0621600 [Ziziphus jujuba]|uniref:B3 domain-containing protein Os03g0621600 n=1 Tax=Ziziphus jujuba TaxID=326968 RepID=A0A6P4AVF1_ZIZJJ|nr:putative B3 domain-containing protein Os03g0621600 [Ziziphus jujuba]